MAELRKTLTAEECPLLIFVTGLPSKSTVQVVLDHFKKYGKVQLYRINNSSQGNRVLQAHASANIKRGFCILKAFNEPTYKKILSSSELFLGRTLAIGPFRQGSELWSHNEHINLRRIIVKKVPSKVTQDALKLAVETQFGTINRMYRFAAESTQKAAKKEKSRKHNTYSIEFDHEASAQKAANNGSLLLPDCENPVVIERFQKKSADQGQNLNQSSTQSKDKNTQNNSSEIDSPKEDMEPGKLLTAEATQPSPSSQNLRRSVTTVDMGYHAHKPTTKDYFADRVILASEGAAIGSAHGSFRFNIPKPTRMQESSQQPVASLQRRVGGYSLFPTRAV